MNTPTCDGAARYLLTLATPGPVIPTTAALLAERATLITYLRQRTDREDWHGVMDAAADIREIDARLADRQAGAR